MAHYRFDGDLSDSAGNFNGISFGNPAYTPGKNGQAIFLDGMGKYVLLPSNIINSPEITIATWVMWNGGEARQRIFDFGNGESSLQYIYLSPMIDNDTQTSSIRNNTLLFGIRQGDTHQYVETSPLPAGQWVHLAVTLQGGIGTIYVNGRVDATSRITLNPALINPAQNFIGKSQWSRDPFFNGMIDDFQLFNQALPATEIAALMSGRSGAASLAACYPFEGSTADSTGSHNLSSYGDPVYTAGRIGRAIQLDGVDDFLVSMNNLVSMDDMTIAVWVYWNGGETRQRIFDFGNGENSWEYLYLCPKFDDDALYFGFRKGSLNQFIKAPPMPAGQWIHLAVTLQGDIGTIYLNGRVSATGAITLNPSDIRPMQNFIGKSQWARDPLFNGSIDDFRIYKTALSAQDILALMNPSVPQNTPSQSGQSVSPTNITGAASIAQPPPPSLPSTTSQGKVKASPADVVTNGDWRTKASLEQDRQYGTDGYLIWQFMAPENVCLENFDVGWRGSEQNAKKRPYYIGEISVSTSQFGVCSGGTNGATTQLQMPVHSTRYQKAGAYYGSSSTIDPIHPVFTIQRDFKNAFRLTVILNDGMEGPNTWNVAVQAGKDDHAAIANQGSGKRNTLTYFVFDIGEGLEPITVDVTYNDTTPPIIGGCIAGFAFDPYVAPSESAAFAAQSQSAAASTWLENYDELKTQSQNLKKPRILYFYLDDVSACQKLESETFEAQSFRDNMKNFVAYRERAESGGVWKQLGVVRVPTLIVQDHMGNPVKVYEFINFEADARDLLQTMENYRP
ncbi:hypothetical protein JXA32_13790 [Candidatus Sumerlaeota bacterium]|nr:hypothetical protein [Candidatus Sumerlaeota bacterium]